MSSHILIPLDGAPSDRTIRVGWDAPLATFFAHVLDNPIGDADEPVALMSTGGQPYEVPDVDVILGLIAPYAVIPSDLREQLIAEEAAEGDSFAGRPGSAVVARVALQNLEDPRQIAAIRAAMPDLP
ncbi:hypothetical protein ACH4YO_40690 [Streptomyces noursei]|uniref:hypothetical protein n=1 Tax=Streptomyces noursei TaxID=1971 RepID=UPI00081D08EC|nr:hypothetical protein SNOUR_00040 [Streptomyces noursei ATCC 11455]ANZ22004.1 hypothetical protein SNOUR_43910 [Streptomyces noursei ATCC 11455]MCZ0996414.1 hypothetical protein [Streptomyces noursei]